MLENIRYYSPSRPEQTHIRGRKQTTGKSRPYHKYAHRQEACGESSLFSFNRSSLILIGSYMQDTNLSIEIMNSSGQISALHAGIHWAEKENTYKLQDTSRDGTSLNGIRVESLRLIPIKNGDVLEMPSTKPRVRFQVTIPDKCHKGIILDSQLLKPEVKIRAGSLK